MADNSACNPQLLLSHKFPETTYAYTERDVALYALGVGACGRDAVDTDELKYLYHENGQQFIKVLPTFSTLFSVKSMVQDMDLPGLRFDPRLLLHGQQYIEVYKPLPSNATIQNKALLYRLSGDNNPLHSDPMVAKVAGYSRPILHGLCTLGFAVRAIIKCICRGDPDMIKNIFGRFLLHVYPGETLVTEMWLEGLRVIYRVKAKQRNRAVLSGYVHLHRLAASL